MCKLFVEKDIIFDLFRGCLNGSNLGKWDLYFFLELFFLFLVLSFFCFFILFIFVVGKFLVEVSCIVLFFLFCIFFNFLIGMILLFLFIVFRGWIFLFFVGDLILIGEIFGRNDLVFLFLEFSLWLEWFFFLFFFIWNGMLGKFFIRDFKIFLFFLWYD